MHTRVGQYPNAGRLMEFMPRLTFRPREKEGQGFAVTQREPTIELFQPMLADVFRGRWIVARCVTVRPGGMIHLHRDPQDENTELLWRMLVVQTNPDAWVFHDGTWQQLEQDGIYQSDQTLPHAAVNFGKEHRLHLVVGTA